MPEGTGVWEKILILIFGFTVTASVSCGLVSSTIYVLKYAGDNLEESVKTIFQIAAYANAVYMMCTAFIKHSDIEELLREYQNIYDASE